MRDNLRNLTFIILVFCLGIAVFLSPSVYGAQPPPDPQNDTIGWENGYWHNESLSISPPYSQSEIQTYVYRTIARIEVLRGTEFNGTVSVNIVPRSEFRGNDLVGQKSPTYVAWNNQVWEALFITGENTNIQNEFRKITGSSVVGYYNYRSDSIVLITEGRQAQTIDGATLSHELTHAMQDDRYNLNTKKYQRVTQDGQLAVDSLIEGEAVVISEMYRERCGVEWRCSLPQSRTPTPNGNQGVHVLLYTPYSEGPQYIKSIKSSRGWSGVDQEFNDPPQSMREVMNPNAEPAEEITVEGTGFNSWERFPSDIGNQGTDRLGQASISVMFWYQAHKYDINVISESEFLNSDDNSRFNYSVSPARGLITDRIVPYRNGSEYAYVWKTKWNDEKNASQFASAYKEIIKGHGGNKKNSSTWVIPEGGFSDAFVVKQENKTVYIVNGPNSKVARELTPGGAPVYNRSFIEKLLPSISLPSLSIEVLVSIVVPLIMGIFFVISLRKDWG